MNALADGNKSGEGGGFWEGALCEAGFKHCQLHLLICNQHIHCLVFRTSETKHGLKTYRVHESRFRVGDQHKDVSVQTKLVNPRVQL